MKARELRDLSVEELQAREGELRRELMNLRFQNATREIVNPKRIPHVKRTIARILTVLEEKGA